MMRHKLAVVGMVTALFFSHAGCIGRMAVTREVSRFNLSVADGRAGREVAFFLLHVLPAYPFAYLIDIFVVNSIEFWSGENPVSGEARLARAGDTRTLRGESGERIVSTLKEDGSIDVELFAGDGSADFVNLQRLADRLVARDAGGAVLGELDDQGRMRLTMMRQSAAGR